MSLYPEIDPYNEEMIKVSDLHTVHFEECGNPKGKPILFLHGGPGGGIDSVYRRYFNPELYRVILVDQRGCGKSIPYAELAENTTWDLVSDLEKIRTHLKIDKWAIFGGSWGSTLALCYSIKHAQQVDALFLRGIFLLREKEIKWFYQEGASKLFPDLWQEYLKPIEKSKHDNLMQAYYEILTGDDEEAKIRAAKSWSIWEASTSKLAFDPSHVAIYEDSQKAIAFARIESHYFINRGFLETDNYILENISAIKGIPTVIVHGRYDIVCPVENAWDLSQRLPNAELKIIENAGHSLSEVEITKFLVEKTDTYGKNAESC